MTGPANRNAPDSHWAGITALVKELRRCEAAGAFLAALVMAYVCIDAMAYLAMSPDKSEQTKQDFIAWVDGYLQAHPDQPYQYRGIDVYAARCALLHAFSSEAALHRKDPAIRLFGYNDGGRRSRSGWCLSDFGGSLPSHSVSRA